MRNFWNWNWSACAFMVVAQLTTARAYPLTNSLSQIEPWRAKLVKSEVCSITGNPDLYGLGIRLGIYFQLFSTLFSNLYIPEAIADIWIANTIFVIAVFSALLKASVERQLYFAEAFIVLQLLYAFMLSVFTFRSTLNWKMLEENTGGWIDTMKRTLKARMKLSFGGVLWKLAMTNGIAAYNIWLWFKGHDKLNDHATLCESYVFLFTKASSYGRAQLFYQIFACFYLHSQGRQLIRIVFNQFLRFLEFVINFNSSTLANLFTKSSLLNCYIGFLSPTITKLHVEISHFERFYPNEGQSKRRDSTEVAVLQIWTWSVRKFVRMTSLCVIIWSILSVELTLKWNGIKGVNEMNSAGQVIPFIIGIFGLCRTAHLIYFGNVSQRQRRQQPRPFSKKEIVVRPKTAVTKYRMRDNRIIAFPLKIPGRRRSFDGGYIDLVRIRHYPENPTTSKEDLLAPVRVELEHPRISKTPQTPAPFSSSSSERSFYQFPKPRGPLNVCFYTLRCIINILDNLGSLTRDTCLCLIFTLLLPVLLVISVITWLVLSFVGRVCFFCMRIRASSKESSTEDSYTSSQTPKVHFLWNGYKDWRKNKYLFENFGALCFVLCFFYASFLYGFWKSLIVEILGPASDN